MTPRMRTLVLWTLGLAPLVLAGCSSSAGRGSFGLFPTHNNELLKTTKAMRSGNGGALPVPRELDKQPLPPYTVEPGDVLLIQPTDLDSPLRLPGDQPVLPDGTIQLGKFGPLLVFGRTLPEIQDLVKAKVAPQGNGSITVRLVARQSKVYYVLGEVNSPGAYPLSGRETVLDALMAAGGLNDRASPDQIVLTRPSRPEDCRAVLPVCYRAIVQLGDTTTNYQIAPGDRVFVPSRGMLETLLPKHHQAPCGGNHVPCPSGAGGCPLPAGLLPPVDDLGLRATAPAKSATSLRRP